VTSLTKEPESTQGDLERIEELHQSDMRASRKGDYAFEWGYIHGKERHKTAGTISSELYHVIRILQRQPDGSWKVHRTIWNEAAK
jgi:ketosteroid isomerase-like protein